MRRLLAIILVIASFAFVGCAGDLGPPTGLLTGAVSFKVNWGTSTAQTAVLMLRASDGTIINKILPRTPGSSTDTFNVGDKVALGPAAFQADFLDPSGVTLSTVQKIVQVTPKTLIEVSVFTIPPDKVALDQNQTIPLGVPFELRFTATDAKGNLAAVPLSLVSYSSSDESVIQTKDAQGKQLTRNGRPVVQGKKLGSANITVTISLPQGGPGVSSIPPEPVTVVPGIGISALALNPKSPVPVPADVTITAMITGDTSKAGVTASLVLLPDRIQQQTPTINVTYTGQDGIGDISVHLPTLTTPGAYQITITSKADPTVSQSAFLIVTANGTVTFHFP